MQVLFCNFTDSFSGDYTARLVYDFYLNRKEVAFSIIHVFGNNRNFF